MGHQGRGEGEGPGEERWVRRGGAAGREGERWRSPDLRDILTHRASQGMEWTVKVTDEEGVDDAGQVEHHGSPAVPQISERQSCSPAPQQRMEPCSKSTSLPASGQPPCLHDPR